MGNASSDATVETRIPPLHRRVSRKESHRRFGVEGNALGLSSYIAVEPLSNSSRERGCYPKR